MNSSLCSSITGALACKKSNATHAAQPTQVEVYQSVSDLPWEQWNTLQHGHSFFLQQEFLTAIENAHRGEMEFRYVLIHKDNRLLAAAYCQIVPFDMKKTYAFTAEDAVVSWSEKIKNALSHRFKYWVSNLDLNLLVCGNVFLSGENGFLFHPSLNPQVAFDLLTESLEKVAKAESKSIKAILVKDYYDKPEHPHQILLQKGYHAFQVEPLMKMQIPAQWRSFEDYLEALSSKYRQRARSAYKKSQVFTTRILTLADIIALNDKMMVLFQSIVNKNSFNMKDASHTYLIELKQALKDNVIFTGYYKDGEFVGFMTMIAAGTTLEPHFLGYDESLNHEYKMYLRILYDIVKYGIEHEFQEICCGRTALEIKTTVGAIPHQAYLYLRLRNSLFNRIAAPVMKSIKTEPFVQRHPFKGQEDKATEGEKTSLQEK